MSNVFIGIGVAPQEQTKTPSFLPHGKAIFCECQQDFA
jgi:hypothetical protein